MADSNVTGPPLVYTQFLGSEMFTILAGPSHKVFHVHKELLAAVSPELKGHVFNKMKEGVENKMVMEEVSEETMCQFLEFCYTGKYTISTLDTVNGPAKNLKECATLLPSGKLYIFGDMYNIPALKTLATTNICQAMRQMSVQQTPVPSLQTITCFRYSQVVNSYLELVEYAFENLPERRENPTDPLLSLLAHLGAWGLGDLRQHQKFHEILSTSGNTSFTKELLGFLVLSGTSPP